MPCFSASSTSSFAIASKSDPPIGTSAVCIKKQALEDIDGFPVGITSGEDLLTWARLAVKYKIAYLNKELAIYYQPDLYLSRPERLPEIPDLVGIEMRNLASEAQDSKKSLNRYIGLWHKMRASIFLQHGINKAAMFEVFKSAHYSGFTLKKVIFIIIAIFPSFISIRLFRLIVRYNNKQYI